jgi:hypothetical protein
METLYFTLGMLSVVAVVLTASVVYGIVKLSKLNKWCHDTEHHIESTRRDMYRIEESTSSHAARRIDDLYSSLWRDKEEISRRLDDLQSYIDSRVDKLDSKFSPKGTKQQING